METQVGGWKWTYILVNHENEWNSAFFMSYLSKTIMAFGKREIVRLCCILMQSMKQISVFISLKLYLLLIEF